MVSVIIASFNRLQALMACIDSINRTSPLPAGGLQTIVVTSTYAPAQIQEIEATGAIVRHLPNRVFVSEAHNVGASSATGSHLLFLDDDNTVDPHAISLMSQALDEWSDAVMVGPVMYYGSDPARIWCAGVQRSRVFMKTRFRTTLREPVPTRLTSEDFPNCFMVRHGDFLNIEGFDVSQFPQHMAESDFACRLVRATGKQVFCVPTAHVWHFIDTSFFRRLHMQDQERAYWVGRGRASFTADYANRLQWLVYVVLGQWALLAVYLAALFLQSSTGKVSVARAYVHGAVDGLRLGFRKRRNGPLAELN